MSHNKNASKVNDLDQMHEAYREGGSETLMAPHVVYSEATCPHPDCDQRLQAVDFRLERHGKDVHDRLVRDWWDDTGFVGRCPGCGHWIHFTIRSKRAVTDDEAAQLPRLPDNWYDEAIIL